MNFVNSLFQARDKLTILCLYAKRYPLGQTHGPQSDSLLLHQEKFHTQIGKALSRFMTDKILRTACKSIGIVINAIIDHF